MNKVADMMKVTGPTPSPYRAPEIIKHGRDTLEPSEDGNMKLRPMQNMVMPVMRRKMMLMYLQSTLDSSRGDTRYPLVIVNWNVLLIDV